MPARKSDGRPSKGAAGQLSLELTWPGKRPMAAPAAVPLERLERGGQPPQDGAGGAVCNQLIWGDNGGVLATLVKDLPGKVDLIAIDPPFASGQDFSMPDSAETVFADSWQGRLEDYLQMMYDRLALARDLLAPTGLIYVHLDTRMNAAVRLILDEVFGPRRLFNEIIWHYQSGGRCRSSFSFKHDTILAYSRGERPFFDAAAVSRPRSQARRNHMKRGVDADGRTYSSIRSANKVYRYYDDESVAPDDVWHDISHLQQKDPERTGYPTQKPLRLLERIVRSSAPAGGLVLDFFSGSGTTPVAAEMLGRRWIACELCRRGIDITRQRLLALPICRPFEVLQASSPPPHQR
jgi:site-specific DNA-methyltransferase (adenine-specific)/adenine-specific DNA-methyltransferase